MVVMKFGGTSVADAAAMRRAAALVAAAPDPQRLVVVSAMAGVTDRLFEAAAWAARGARAEALRVMDELASRHLAAAEVAGESAAVESLRRQLRDVLSEARSLVGALAVVREVSPRSLDAVAATGEVLSSRLMASALAAQGVEAVWIDAREILVTDGRHGRAEPRLKASAAALAARVRPLLEASVSRVVVTGGYIGATADGATTTLGRGGSDYSAAVMGACLGAREIQIWTDVDGILTADPRLVPDARPVPWVSPEEAAELAYFGAKVLHPSTTAPAVAAGVPVRILNARHPEAPGTLVSAVAHERGHPLAAIACKRGVTLVDIRSSRMLMAHGFLARVFSVFEQYETAVDVVTTSEVSVSVTVDEPARLAGIVEAIGGFAEVSCEPAMAILCIVGDGLACDPVLAGRVLAALEGLPLRMVSQAASRRNLTLVLPDGAAPAAMARLHERLFGGRDREPRSVTPPADGIPDRSSGPSIRHG